MLGLHSFSDLEVDLIRYLRDHPNVAKTVYAFLIPSSLKEVPAKASLGTVILKTFLNLCIIGLGIMMAGMIVGLIASILAVLMDKDYKRPKGVVDFLETVGRKFKELNIKLQVVLMEKTISSYERTIKLHEKGIKSCEKGIESCEKGIESCKKKLESRKKLKKSLLAEGENDDELFEHWNDGLGLEEDEPSKNDKENEEKTEWTKAAFQGTINKSSSEKASEEGKEASSMMVPSTTSEAVDEEEEEGVEWGEDNGKTEGEKEWNVVDGAETY